MITPRVACISRSQAAVLAELLRDGASNRDIAARLHVTENTVKSHMQRVAKALGVQGRSAIAVACLRRQVIVRVVTQPSKEATE